MAVELINDIPDVAWSNNPIRLEMQSNLTIEQLGATYNGRLGFRGIDNQNWTGPIAGSLLTLQMYGVNHTFTFKSNPRLGLNELPVYTSSLGISGWFDLLVTYFSSNSFVNNYYTLSYDIFIGVGGFPLGLNVISFISKEQRDEATITFIGDGLNLYYGEVSRGQTLRFTKNLKIYAELWVYTSSGKRMLLSANLPTDTLGKAIWDISIPLHNHVGLNHQETTADAGIVKYHVTFVDVYGLNQVLGNYVNTTDKFAVYGGVPNNRIGESVEDTLLKEGKLQWLSPKSDLHDVVIRNQEYMLSLFNPGPAINEVKICAMLQFSDGISYELELATVDLLSKKKLFVNVMDSRIFNTYPNEILTSWQIYLKSDLNTISAIAKFDLESSNKPYLKLLKYMNSLGAYSYINIYGKGTKGYNLSKSSASVFMGNGSVQTQDIAISTRDIQFLRTGYITKSELDSFRDFFLSLSKYIHVSDRWEKIIVTNQSIDESKDGVNLYTLDFEIEQSTEEYVWGYK